MIFIPAHHGLASEAALHGLIVNRRNAPPIGAGDIHFGKGHANRLLPFDALPPAHRAPLTNHLSLPITPSHQLQLVARRRDDAERPEAERPKPT
jgi:hypothetical protein